MYSFTHVKRPLKFLEYRLSCNKRQASNKHWISDNQIGVSLISASLSNNIPDHILVKPVHLVYSCASLMTVVFHVINFYNFVKRDLTNSINTPGFTDVSVSAIVSYQKRNTHCENIAFVIVRSKSRSQQSGTTDGGGNI